MPPLSVVVITYNEENNIGRCLDSVQQIADEIIILDSFSTDRTAEIGKSKGAKFYQQKFQGYGRQKNDALDHCTHDMVLSLDADEALSPFLIEVILRLKQSAFSNAYSMNRCTNYCGKFIRHGSWYPDKKVRLFNRKFLQWGNSAIHEKVEVPVGITIQHLQGDILHFSFNSISEHVDQNNKFSSISAQTLFTSGKRTSLFKIVINPLWAFVLSYIVRLGFLDGFFGFVVAINISHLTFLKHSKLLSLQRMHSTGSDTRV